MTENKLVGLQTSVFWLPYFPSEMRFHFNAHNLIVYGKEQNDYLISDPVFESVQRCTAEDLQRARFAKGALAPKGLMYYFENQPDLTQIDLPNLIRKAIRKMPNKCWLRSFRRCKGIRTVAKQIENWQRILRKNTSDYI